MGGREIPDATMTSRRGNAPLPAGAGRHQAPATAPKSRNPSVDRNDIPEHKNNPQQCSAVIRTHRLAKLAMTFPGHKAECLDVGDKLSFND
jgi:hypothetical protein